MKNLLLTAVCVCLCIAGFSAYNESDSVSFYLKKAKEFTKVRKVWEAEKSFQKAIQFDPSNDAARLDYADYLVDLRKFFPAVEQVGKVLEKDNNHKGALEKMVNISFLLKRWTDVVMYGNKLLQSGKFENAGFVLGKSYYELENYGQAQKLLKQAVAENPKDSKSVTLLGKVLIEMSNYKEAIAIYHQTLELSPNDNQLLYELGLLYYTMNNEKEAVKYFEQAAEKGYKTDLDYYENVGLAYLGFDLKKGVETLQKVLEMKPGSEEILFQIAQAYYKAEKFKDAAIAYQNIFDNNNSNSRALYMAGLSYQKYGDKNKGVAICEQAIRMDPNLAQLKSVQSKF